jgi:hypothetical protein
MVRGRARGVAHAVLLLPKRHMAKRVTKKGRRLLGRFTDLSIGEVILSATSLSGTFLDEECG